MLGIILLSAVGVIVVAVVFTGLTWAAVQDGRDDRSFRGVHPELDEVIATRRPVPMPRQRRQVSRRFTPMRNSRPSMVAVTAPSSPAPS